MSKILLYKYNNLFKLMYVNFINELIYAKIKIYFIQFIINRLSHRIINYVANYIINYVNYNDKNCMNITHI